MSSPVFETGLPKNTLEGLRRQIRTCSARYGDSPRLKQVLELSVTASRGNLIPAVFAQHPEHFGDLHVRLPARARAHALQWRGIEDQRDIREGSTRIPRGLHDDHPSEVAATRVTPSVLRRFSE